MNKVLSGVATLVAMGILAFPTTELAVEPPADSPVEGSGHPAPAVTNGAPAESAAPETASHASVSTSLTPAVDEIPSAGRFQRGWNSVAAFCAGHLQVGAGVSSYSLRDNSGKGRFLGSIDELKQEEDMFIPLVLGWSFNRYVGLECRYEEYRARAYTDTEDNHTDGVVVLKGPVPYLVGSLPLDVPAGWLADAPPAWTKRLAFRVGVGYTLMSNSMETEPWWGLGYSSPATYEALGSPGVRREGNYRTFHLSDSQEMVWLLGASGQVGKRMSVNVNWTRADVDVDAAFSIRGGKKTPGVIPFHYDSLGVDVRYVF